MTCSNKSLDGVETIDQTLSIEDGVELNDGTSAQPSLRFTNDTDTGLYRIGANNLGVSAGGTAIADFDATRLNVAGNIVASGTVAGLTQAELTQLANIDSTTISTTQWGYLGGLNQDLRTNQDVDFARINTGQGYHEIYETGQPLTQTSTPTFSYVILTKGYRNPNSGGLKSTATQSIADNTSTLVTWNTTEWDTQIPSVIGASNDLVAGRQAIYQVNAQVCFAANATGKRSLCIFLNGGNIRCVEMNAINGTDPTFLNISFQIELNVNDALTCYVYQNSGGNLNIGDASAAERQSYFQMSYCGFDDQPS